MGNREKFIEKANKRHNFKYNYEKVEYIGSKNKVCIICPEHGEFWQEPAAHVRGNGCPICANYKRGIDKRWDKDKFIQESIKFHGEKYDYSQVEYKNVREKVKIFCPEHGFFEQLPSVHIQGQGCPKCAGKNMLNNEIIDRFIKIHGNKYDYSKVYYKGSDKKVCIICPEHGEFYQIPSKHLMGQGCKECAKIEKGLKLRLTNKEFENKARSIHGDKYDYSEVEYKTSHDKIKIICPEHGEFWQKPNDHLQGHGCPSCSKMYSIGEMDIYDFIVRKLNHEKILLRDRNILEGKEIDIFIPSKNIGFEYNGLYWHSEANGKNKWYHFNKTKECEKKDIKLFQIFEDEYINKKNILFEKIRHLLKIEKICPKIMGRKVKIKEININRAKEFLDENNIEGYTNSTVRLGAYYQGILIGVMCLTKTGHNNEWILTRFATDIKYICQGVIGKLLSHFIKIYNPCKIISFANKRWVNNNDNIYLKLGFKLIKELNPNYDYIEKNNSKKRINKTILKNKSLHNNYNLPIEMSEKNVAKFLELIKIWNCGYLKYEWNKKMDY